ncbi:MULTISPECIES: hypothetical protein [Prochlorococcus]|uniref:hypothetical protein n=1 Tax=Prochlorococcus TaxID=1218 RepID=UPI000A751233|nr:hypothetical protein [Prochlorococcus marinus]
MTDIGWQHFPRRMAARLLGADQRVLYPSMAIAGRLASLSNWLFRWSTDMAAFIQG